MREGYDGLIARLIKSKRQALLWWIARKHDWRIPHVPRLEVRLYPSGNVGVRPMEEAFHNLTNLLVVRWIGVLQCFKSARFVEINCASRSSVTRRNDGSPKQYKNRYDK